MKPLLAILVAIMGIAAVSGDVYAGSSKCKSGQIYDENARKCVTPHGS